MFRILSAIAFALLLTGCETLPEELPQGRPGHAMAPQPTGPLAELEVRLHDRLGKELSGFWLLHRNEEGLRWRLALIDSARHSLDLQYYVWWGDESGSLIMRRVLAAADRGVKVRIIVDDLTTMFNEVSEPKVRDAAAAVLDVHPNIDFRLFNPWRQRTMIGRVFESMAHPERVNQRMHNKAMIADNRAAIVGGRNIGNAYFGLSPDFNFLDLDALGVGPVARQTSDVFDRFWNSEWVVPASRLGVPVTPRDLQGAYGVLEKRIRATKKLSRFGIRRKEWHKELALLAREAHPGRSQVHTDSLDDDDDQDGNVVEHVLPMVILELLEGAEREALLANPYIIPGEEVIAWLRQQIGRGIRYRALTNSLASNDVTAVNSHYKPWREPLLRMGVGLYEFRPDGAVKPRLVDTPPVRSKRMGLHVKAMVIDRRKVFIGSMNFDPRSWNLNSEMGVVVESPALSADLAAAIERYMQPRNAWRLKLEPDGDIQWIAEDQVRDMQPARSFWQRVQDMLFMMLPRSLY